MRRFAKIDKYGMPILIVMLLTIFSVKTQLCDIPYYQIFFDLWGSFLVMFFCFREMYHAYRLRKCKWQKASIIGVGLFCLVDILFYGNYINESGNYSVIYVASQYWVLSITLISILYYYLNEKDYL